MAQESEALAPSILLKFPMTSTAQAYRSPDGSESAKSLSLVERAEASTLHPRDRVVLVFMLKEFNAFAVVGSRNELYASQKTVAQGVGLSYPTVRRRIDRMQSKGVLVEVYGSNKVVRTSRGYELRRPATYQVDESKLEPRETVKEYVERRNRQRCARPFRQHSPHAGARPASHPQEEVKREDVPKPLTPPIPLHSNSSSEQKARAPARTRRDCKRVLAMMDELLSGREAGTGPPPKEFYADALHDLAHELGKVDIAKAVALHILTFSSVVRTSKGPPDLAAIEYRLQKRERELLDILAHESDQTLLQQIEQETNDLVRPYVGRMPSVELDKLRLQCAAKLLLQAWKLPQLTVLFMPEKRIAAAAPADRMGAFRKACRYFHFDEASVREGFRHWQFELVIEEDATT